MPTVTASIFLKGKSESVSVNVSSRLGFSTIDERMIVETVLGLRDLHNSARTRGAPVGMIGYIHNESENTILAVTAMDSDGRSISIPKGGEAKNGNHVFK